MSDGRSVTNELLKPLAAHAAALGPSAKAPILMSSASSPSIMSMATSASDHLLKTATVSAAKQSNCGSSNVSQMLDLPSMSTFQGSKPPPSNSVSQLNSTSSGTTPLVSGWFLGTNTSPCTSPFLGRRAPQFFIPDNSKIDTGLLDGMHKMTSTGNPTIRTDDIASCIGKLNEQNSISASKSATFQPQHIEKHEFIKPIVQGVNSNIGIGRNKSYHAGLSFPVSTSTSTTLATVAAPVKSKVEQDRVASMRTSGSQGNGKNERTQSTFRFNVANFDLNAVGPSSW